MALSRRDVNEELARRRARVSEYIDPTSAYFDLYTVPHPSLDKILHIPPSELPNAPNLSSAIMAHSIMRRSSLQGLLPQSSQIVDRGIVSRVVNGTTAKYADSKHPPIAARFLFDLGVGTESLGIAFYDAQTGNLLLSRRSGLSSSRKNTVIAEASHFLTPSPMDEVSHICAYQSGALIDHERRLRKINRGRPQIAKYNLTVKPGTQMRRFLSYFPSTEVAYVFLINPPSSQEVSARSEDIWNHIKAGCKR